jgi:hypothetical protein
LSDRPPQTAEPIFRLPTFPPVDMNICIVDGHKCQECNAASHA